MKILSFLTSVMLVLFFAACSSGVVKKVYIMSSGKMQTEGDKKTIIFNPGNQHNEMEIILAAGDKTVTVKSPDGEKTYDVPDNGLYLLNLKSDTIIGSQVNYGNSGIPSSINSQELEHIIDSTQQLMSGQNASDEKKTYFLVPNSIKKITDNLNAQLLGPYKNIPQSVEKDASGNVPEMYKFYTNNQKREALNELLERMTK